MLIVPEVARFSLVASNGTRPVVNIWDAQIRTYGTTVNRAEACRRYAGRLLDAWKAHVMLSLHNGYVFQDVRWVDLDSANGSTGQRSSTVTTTLPQQGSVGGAPAAPNTSALVTKVATAGRGKRSGRCFLSPLSEAQVDYFVLESTSLAALQDRMDAFLNASFFDDEPTVYEGELHVVHATAAEIENSVPGTSDIITALTVQQRPATQRRRLRK